VITEKVMWDLCWIIWPWYVIFSYYFVIPFSMSFHTCSTDTHVNVVDNLYCYNLV